MQLEEAEQWLQSVHSTVAAMGLGTTPKKIRVPTVPHTAPSRARPDPRAHMATAPPMLSTPHSPHQPVWVSRSQHERFQRSPAYPAETPDVRRRLEPPPVPSSEIEALKAEHQLEIAAVRMRTRRETIQEMTAVRMWCRSHRRGEGRSRLSARQHRSSLRRGFRGFGEQTAQVRTIRRATTGMLFQAQRRALNQWIGVQTIHPRCRA